MDFPAQEKIGSLPPVNLSLEKPFGKQALPTGSPAVAPSHVVVELTFRRVIPVLTSQNRDEGRKKSANIFKSLKHNLAPPVAKIAIRPFLLCHFLCHYDDFLEAIVGKGETCIPIHVYRHLLAKRARQRKRQKWGKIET